METKIRVLIADPNEDFQLLMKSLLSQEGDMEAAGTSSDGSDALAKIEALHPDVVLLELVQPRLDGLGVLRKLAEKDSAPPVVVLTGFVNAHVVAECAELGAAYFLSKPCDTPELIQRLRRVRADGQKAAVRHRNKKFRGDRAGGEGGQRLARERRYRHHPRDRRSGAY